MTYSEQYAAMQADRFRRQCRIQARRKRRYKRIRAAIRTAAGWTTAIMFVLILGKAGASDCGAAWEEIFPSTLVYTLIAAISFYVWELFGGNQPYNNNKYNGGKRK